MSYIVSLVTFLGALRGARQQCQYLGLFYRQGNLSVYAHAGRVDRDAAGCMQYDLAVVGSVPGTAANSLCDQLGQVYILRAQLTTSKMGMIIPFVCLLDLYCKLLGTETVSGVFVQIKVLVEACRCYLNANNY